MSFKIKNLAIWNKLLGNNWTNWLRVHHILDWITVVLVFLASGLLGWFVPPIVRFLPQDSSLINYPVKPDIVPAWALMIIVLVVPLFVFGVAQIWQRSHHDFHHATLGVIAAFALTNLIVTVLKLSTGRYRPNFQNGEAISNWDGRSAFPSGHAALSFSSMVFTSLYIAGKLRIFRDHTGSLVIKAIVILLPLSLSFFVSISRVIDYHHDFSDIEAGALIGTAIAFMCYFLWYHSLFSRNSGIPRMHPVEVLPTVNPDAKIEMKEQPRPTVGQQSPRG